MDVSDERNFLMTYGTLIIDEVLKVYEETENRILYIDAVEKYFVLENQQTFEDLLQMFISAGWKIILTIRTAYKDSFHANYAQTECQFRYCGTAIPFLTVRSTAR